LITLLFLIKSKKPAELEAVRLAKEKEEKEVRQQALLAKKEKDIQKKAIKKERQKLQNSCKMGVAVKIGQKMICNY
uniref:Uncharacterized protein n=1 Tax=Mus spicilegus TaxID=10103 RepID=A0A8C6GE39_MUSSI